MGGVSLTALTFISTSSGGGGGGGVREVEVTTEGQIEVESSKMDQTKGTCKSADFLLLHHQLTQTISRTGNLPDAGTTLPALSLEHSLHARLPLAASLILKSVKLVRNR